MKFTYYNPMKEPLTNVKGSFILNSNITYFKLDLQLRQILIKG